MAATMKFVAEPKNEFITSLPIQEQGQRVASVGMQFDEFREWWDRMVRQFQGPQQATEVQSKAELPNPNFFKAKCESNAKGDLM